MKLQPWQRNVYLIWVSVFIAATCWTMVMPFMPVFLKEELGVLEGVEAWAGVMGAAGSLAQGFVAPVWGAVGDRFGRKAMMLRAGIFLTVAYVLMSLVQEPYGLLGIRIMIGALTGFIPMATALVGTATEQEHVGKALAVVSTAAPTGSILGPMFGGALSDLLGIRATMLLSAGLVAGATMLVFATVREQFTPVKKKEGGSLLRDMGEVLQNKTFAAVMVTNTLFTASMFSMEPMLVPFIKGLLGSGSPNWLAGALYSLPGLAFVLTASFWATRAQRWGFQTTVTLGLALGAAIVLPQAIVGNAWQFGGLRLAQGVATASVNPGIAALIASVVPVAMRGKAYGINQSAFAAGAMLGPLLGGFMATYAGPRWSFVITACMLAGAAAWARFVVSPRVAAQKQTA